MGGGARFVIAVFSGRAGNGSAHRSGQADDGIIAHLCDGLKMGSYSGIAERPIRRSVGGKASP